MEGDGLKNGYRLIPRKKYPSKCNSMKAILPIVKALAAQRVISDDPDVVELPSIFFMSLI